MRLSFRGTLIWGALAAGAMTLVGEDADRFRPYLTFRYGEMSAAWGVHDHWGLGVGANLNRHWGVELNLDSFQSFPEDGTGRAFGEEAITAFVPQVRYRIPMVNDRIVPYVIAGVGPAFAQFNDRKAPAYGRDVDLDGTALGVAVGGGVDFFVGDGVALNLEAKYLHVSPVSGSFDGVPIERDFSNFLLSAGFRVYWSENASVPFDDGLDHPGVRWFFGARFGGAANTDGQWTDNAGLVRPASSFLGGWAHNGGISVGALFGRYLGVELAGDLYEPNLTYDGLGTIGEYAIRTVVPQLLLRLPIGEGRWVPHLNAGVGFAHAEYNDRKPPGGAVSVDAMGIYPAMRMGGGVEYFVTSSFSLDATLQWVRTWDHSISINGGAAEHGAVAALQAQFGFRVYFNGHRGS